MDSLLPTTDSEHLVVVWQKCLKIISEQITGHDYNTWFIPIKPERLEENRLILFLPEEHFYQHLEANFVVPMRDALDRVLGVDAQIGYVFPIQDKDEGVRLPAQLNHVRSQQLVEQKFNERYEESPINPNYVFENFIEGGCNRLARSAGWAVAQKPGTTSFNPLMLYGGVGLGKTHLMQAVGNYIKKNSPEKRIIYVSVDKFTTQFVNSLKNNDLETFKKYYEQVDLLLLDDIQFLTGKESTQEIFFHIFNHLQQSGRQIIMTSDCAPIALKGMADRLLSRFKWGISADLQQPDMETRMAIIQRKLQEKDIVFPPDVIEYLTQNVDSNVRELEGALNSLIHNSLHGVTLNVELAQQMIKNLIQSTLTRETNVDDVLKAVADYFAVSFEELKGKSRKKEIVLARQIAMYLAKEFTPNSLKSIGIILGGRDHSTVIHAIQTISDMVAEKKDIQTAVEDIRKKLENH